MVLWSNPGTLVCVVVNYVPFPPSMGETKYLLSYLVSHCIFLNNPSQTCISVELVFHEYYYVLIYTHHQPLMKSLGSSHASLSL